MKILFFIESLRPGGKERRLVELIKGLSKYPDIEMELVLTKEDIHYTDIFETKIKINYTIRKGLKKDPRVFFKFYKIAKTFEPDIIHVWGNMVAIYAILAKVLLKIPMINNQITEVPLKVTGGLFSYKLTFPFSDKIISNSNEGIKTFKVPVGKSICIYNGFDFNRLNCLIDKKLVKDKFKITTDDLVGMVATFSHYKDYLSYIKSAISICLSNNNVTFLTVGAGDSSQLKKLVPYELNNRILFLGQQTNIESIMNVCDIGVLASFTEGISNSLMEFMALSKPVVASGKGGTKELVVEGENGFLVDSNNDKLLTEKINLLLDNKELRQKMGIKSKLIIEEKFEISIMIKKYLTEYHNLCAE